jgi:two-component system nitrate/nitrite response regulator NarL
MADSRSRILSQLKIVFGEKHVRHFTDAIIVDKSALFRAGMSRVLTNTRFRVKATVASVAAIPESALRGKANAILLMGVDGSSKTDLSNLSSLKSNYPLLNVVALGGEFELKAVCEALAAGADGYLLKGEITTEGLLKSLEVILLGEAVLPRRLTQLLRLDSGMLLDESPKADDLRLPSDAPAVATESEAIEIEKQRPTIPSFEGLSEREQIILDHIAKGETNKHIARDLNVAEATVKVHVKAILRKVKVQNRTQAAIWAMSTLKLSEAATTVHAMPLDPVEGLAG